MDKIIDLNPDTDPLAKLEEELREAGKWMISGKNEKLAHYFVAKNRKIDTAISLCFSRIAAFQNLRNECGEQHCLVCALYEQTRKEVRDVIIDKAKSALVDVTQEDAPELDFAIRKTHNAALLSRKIKRRNQ